MPLPEETRLELEAMRLRLLEMLVPLQPPEGEEGSSPAQEAVAGEDQLDEECLRQALWTAVRELDPLLRDARVPARLDLTRNDAGTQQILYDFVIREYFMPHPLDDPGDIFIPSYTPDECGLRVFFDYGRWFVTWLKLEEDMSRQEALTRELLVFEKDQNGRLVFTEV